MQVSHLNWYTFKYGPLLTSLLNSGGSGGRAVLLELHVQQRSLNCQLWRSPWAKRLAVNPPQECDHLGLHLSPCCDVVTLYHSIFLLLGSSETFVLISALYSWTISAIASEYRCSSNNLYTKKKKKKHEEIANKAGTKFLLFSLKTGSAFWR